MIRRETVPETVSRPFLETYSSAKRHKILVKIALRSRIDFPPLQVRVGAEQIHEVRRKRHQPPLRGFRVGSRYVNIPSRELDVFPIQTKQLGRSETGKRPDRQNGKKIRWRSIQERLKLLWLEYLGRFASDRYLLDRVDRITLQQ